MTISVEAFMKKFSDEKLAVTVKNSISIADVLKTLGMSISTGNYRLFHKKYGNRFKPNYSL